MQENVMSQDWMSVIGRSLARIAMHVAEVDDKTISERAAFLENLGLSRKEIAAMLGSSPASVAELLRLRSKKEEPNAKNKRGIK